MAKVKNIIPNYFIIFIWERFIEGAFELLLTADTTVSSDFLQVCCKNLEPTSTAAAE